MKPDLFLVKWFIKNLIIFQNLARAYLYNVITIALALRGIISPMIVAITMSCSDLVLVENSLRLRT